jgi:hypothetical protein
MTERQIVVGTWKAPGEYEWIIVDKVHRMQVNGRVRTVPSVESDWIGSPASFKNLRRTDRRTVNATCTSWDLRTCVRVLDEHWINYESVFGVRRITLPSSPQFVVVSMSVEAISDDEAVELVEGALGVAGAEWIDCRIRASVGWGSAS